MLLATFRRAHSNSKRVFYLLWQNKYFNLNSIFSYNAWHILWNALTAQKMKLSINIFHFHVFHFPFKVFHFQWKTSFFVQWLLANLLLAKYLISLCCSFKHGSIHLNIDSAMTIQKKIVVTIFKKIIRKIKRVMDLKVH